MTRKLDEELAEAAAELEEDADLPAPDPPRDGRSGKRSVMSARAEPGAARRRQLGLLVALLVIVGATVTLFLFGFKAGSIYAAPVDEFLARSAELGNRRVRIEGELVPGSLLRRDSPCEYRFKVKSKDKVLEVVYAQCVVPENFVDRPEGGVIVTAEGTLNKAGTFDAASLTTKCSSRYDPATRTMKPQ